MTKATIPGLIATAAFLGACATTDPSSEAADTLLASVGVEVPVTDPTQFHPPESFMGYRWGTPVDAIPNLKLVHPGGVAVAANYGGKVLDVQINNCSPGEDAAPCEIRQTIQGEGSYVIATYYRHYEPRHPYPGVDVKLALYYFCARTSGDSVTPHVRKRLKLCGGDILFTSDAPTIWEQGAAPTDYEKVVSKLNAIYGRHDGFEFSGLITVTDGQGRRYTFPKERTYEPLTWCRKSQRALYASCEATISLHFDREEGLGQVLYATNAMHRMAEALHELSEDNVPLYERINGFEIDRYKSKRRVCTGTHLCGESSRALTERELDVFRMGGAGTVD